MQYHTWIFSVLSDLLFPVCETAAAVISGHFQRLLFEERGYLFCGLNLGGVIKHICFLGVTPRYKFLDLLLIISLPPLFRLPWQFQVFLFIHMLSTPRPPLHRNNRVNFFLQFRLYRADNSDIHTFQDLRHSFSNPDYFRKSSPNLTRFQCLSHKSPCNILSFRNVLHLQGGSAKWLNMTLNDPRIMLNDLNDLFVQNLEFRLLWIWHFEKTTLYSTSRFDVFPRATSGHVSKSVIPDETFFARASIVFYAVSGLHPSFTNGVNFIVDLEADRQFER